MKFRNFTNALNVRDSAHIQILNYSKRSSLKFGTTSRSPRLLQLFTLTCLLIPLISYAGEQEKTGLPQVSLTADDAETWLDGLVPSALQVSDIAGAVVVVVKNGDVLLEKGFGFADIAAKVPMDPRDTVVRVGSTSKLFVWTSVIQLVEQDKIDLDRDINEYLDFRIPPTFDKPITMRNLMTHTPGFEDYWPRKLSKGEKPLDLGAYLKTRPIPERIYPPGEMVAYSNYGTTLAGYIVERVSGESYADYVEHHILNPLGMDHSTYRNPPPADMQDRMTKYYDVASAPRVNSNISWQLGIDPAGSFAGTADDMARFMLAYLQQGQYAGYSLLQPETVHLIHYPEKVPVPGSSLGFWHIKYNGQNIFQHTGDGDIGEHAGLYLLSDQGVGLFIAFNSHGNIPGAFIAADFLRDSILHAFIDRYFLAPAAVRKPTAATAKKHAQLVAGEYRMARRPAGDFMEARDMLVRVLALKTNIIANEDGTIEIPPFMTFDLHPHTWREVAPFTWQDVDGRGQLHMNVANGRVKSVRVEALPFWFYEPVPRLWSAELHIRLLGFAFALLLLSTLLWPISAIMRRHYDRRLELQGQQRTARLFTQFGALIGVIYLFGWLVLLAADVPSQIHPDIWIRLVQLIGLLCIPAAGIAIWSLWLAWKDPRGFWAKPGSVLTAFALVEVVWFSFAFHLISLRLNY